MIKTILYWFSVIFAGLAAFYWWRASNAQVITIGGKLKNPKDVKFYYGGQVISATKDKTEDGEVIGVAIYATVVKQGCMNSVAAICAAISVFCGAVANSI